MKLFLSGGTDGRRTTQGTAGEQWTPAEAYDKPLCASLDGFTLHAATRAGALDPTGREALLRYVLRPPVAQERVDQRPEGLVRITLKKAYTDGTIAVDMDPLSLLCRLAPSVPPPRFHTEVRGSAGAGEPVEVASRAAASPSRRRERRAR
jgi:Putative transposase